MSDPKTESLSDRTIQGMQEILNRTLGYVQGMERTVVSGAVQMLYPKLSNRIQQMPEQELRTELQQVRDLINKILDEPRNNKTLHSQRKRSRRRKIHDNRAQKN